MSEMNPEVARLIDESSDVMNRAGHVVDLLLAEVRDLRVRVKELEADRRWRRLADEKPADGQKCLLWTQPDGVMILGTWDVRHHGFEVYAGNQWHRVTHWMPEPDGAGGET